MISQYLMRSESPIFLHSSTFTEIPANQFDTLHERHFLQSICLALPELMGELLIVEDGLSVVRPPDVHVRADLFPWFRSIVVDNAGDKGMINLIRSINPFHIIRSRANQVV